jgi:hypothetical protein
LGHNRNKKSGCIRKERNRSHLHLTQHIVHAPNFQYREQSRDTVHVDKSSHYTVAKTSPEKSTNRQYTSLKLNKNRFTNHAFPGLTRKAGTMPTVTSLKSSDLTKNFSDQEMKSKLTCSNSNPL